MNELAIREVYSYIEANKRFQLGFLIPSLRNLDRQLPLHLDFFDLATSAFTINSITYEFQIAKKSINRPTEPSDDYPAIVSEREPRIWYEQWRKTEVAERIRTRRDKFLRDFQEQGHQRTLQYFKYRIRSFDSGNFHRYFGCPWSEVKVFPENSESLEDTVAIQAIKQTRLELTEKIEKIESKCEELNALNDEMTDLEYYKENLKILEVLIHPPEIFEEKYQLRISDSEGNTLETREINIQNPNLIELFASFISKFLRNRKSPISVRSLKISGYTPIPEDIIWKPTELGCRYEIIENWKNLDLSGLERLSVSKIDGGGFVEFCQGPVISNLKFLRVDADDHGGEFLLTLPIKEIEVSMYKRGVIEYCDLELMLLWIEKQFDNPDRIGSKFKILSFNGFDHHCLDYDFQYELIETIDDGGKKYWRIDVDETREIRISMGEEYLIYNRQMDDQIETNDISMEVVEKILVL